MQLNTQKKIAIFASGAGTNAQKIIEYFNHPPKKITVALIVCNKPNAGVINVAKKNDIPVLLIEKEKFFKGNAYVDELKNAEIDLIVLAGFLWKLPSQLTKAFSEKIINIHPALLPKFGGKGMYGNFVHGAVISTGEKQSGITIHIVDDLYDHGKQLFQITCPVLPNDTPESLSKRIHELEHKYYPKVIEEYLKL
ncbi:MAG: phosphoribosylglycinamide formyltransferase [Chitinophagaceae bacterium]